MHFYFKVGVLKLYLARRLKYASVRFCSIFNYLETILFLWLGLESLLEILILGIFQVYGDGNEERGHRGIQLHFGA